MTRRSSGSLAAGLGCLGLLAACGTPVGVRRADPRTVHRMLTANVLSTGAPSGPTANVLYRRDLDERFAREPEQVLAELHGAVVAGRGGSDDVFALAELSFRHAEDTGVRAYYLAAAVYAYAFLFPGGDHRAPSPFDPRLRLASDLYNRGITAGFASADRSEVEPHAGTFALPFGTLEVEFDPADLEWEDRRLEHFVPVAELEVRGIDDVSRTPLQDLALTDQARDLLRRIAFVHPQPFVRRVVFIATPQHGSYFAGSRLAHWAARFITIPLDLTHLGADLVTRNREALAFAAAGQMPTAVDNMTPGNRFIRTLSSIPVVPGVATHSIIAVQGDGPADEGADGVVEYRSAHLDGVESELVVRSGHSCQANPHTIAEVRRILLLHAEEPAPAASRAAGGAATGGGSSP